MRNMPSEAPWAPGWLLGASWVPHSFIFSYKFSISQKKLPQNSNIRVFLKGDVFFLKIKGPCQATAKPSSELVFKKTKKIKELWQRWYHFPKRYARQDDATSFLYPMQISFFFFARNLFSLMEIAQKQCFAYYLHIMCILFAYYLPIILWW